MLRTEGALANMWRILFMTSLSMVLDEALLQNVALIKGQTLKQECQIDATAEFLSWVFIRSGTNNEQTVFTENKGIADNYKGRVNISNGSRVLMITSVQLEDAGVYGCKSKRKSSVEIERAEVVVLDGNLKMYRINSSLVSCKAIYKGNWLPTIELFQSGLNGFEINFGNYVKHNDVSSTVMVKASFTPNSSFTFHCRLYFGNKSTGERMITNIPTYNESIVCILGPSEDNCSLPMPETLRTPAGVAETNVEHKTITILSGVIGFVSLGLFFLLIGVCLKKTRDSKRTLSTVPNELEERVIPSDSASGGIYTPLQTPGSSQSTSASPESKERVVQHYSASSDGINTPLQTPGSSQSTTTEPSLKRSAQDEAILESSSTRRIPYVNVILDATSVSRDRVMYENVSMDKKGASFKK